jgi:hypothetical protein
MSWNPTLEPACPDAADLDAIETCGRTRTSGWRR